MNIFAGFWVDGAVRRPELRHCDCEGLVVMKCKAGRIQELFCEEYTSVSDEYFWLDTTPRESLTPEELFSLLKVIWPKTEVVNNPEGGAVVEWQVPHDATDDPTPISWNGLTQYPPDLDWVRVTKDNVSQHLFKDCRWRDPSGNWRDGQVLGWDLPTGRCIVHHNYHDFSDCVKVRVEASTKGSE